MKRNYLILGFIFMIIAASFIFLSDNRSSKPDVETLREQHKMALENSPYINTKKLTKQERIDLSLPPNAYNEQVWDLTMDPSTGRPMLERLAELQDKLIKERQANRGVGGDNNNPWIDRGPNNVGEEREV